jgi:1-acyl-sn-glycerol-3-phosphate acyltransferase
MSAIEDGAIFGLAPEGTRSKEGAMEAAKDGAAYLAVRSHVPVVPVGLVNTDELFANVRRFRRSRIEAFVGKPFTLPDLGRRVRSRDLAAYTHLIMVQIAAQLPQRYHGLYADSPALHALQAGDDPWPYCLALIEQKEGSK